MDRLDQVITNIVDVFMDYADDEGKKQQLNKEELKKMLEQEIQSPELKGKINADDIGEAMEMLDKNHDGEVNFRSRRCWSRKYKVLSVLTEKGEKELALLHAFVSHRHQSRSSLCIQHELADRLIKAVLPNK